MVVASQSHLFPLVIILVAVASSPAFGATFIHHGVNIKANRAGLKASAPVAAPPVVPLAVPAAAPTTVASLLNATRAAGAHKVASQGIADFRVFLTTRNLTMAFQISRFCLLFVAVGIFYLFGLRWDINMNAEMTKKSPARADPIAFRSNILSNISTVRDATSPKDSPAFTQLPTIWPKFTKLHSTSQLLMPVMNSSSDAWSHNVISPTGTPLLAVSLSSRTGASRSLELSTVGLGRLVLASVTEDCLECFGLGGAKLGKFVFHEGALLLIAIDGQRLASTTKDSDGANVKVMDIQSSRLLGTQVERPASESLSEAYLELTIQPGVDMVFVLACMMAIRIFGSDDILADNVRALEVDANLAQGPSNLVRHAD